MTIKKDKFMFIPFEEILKEFELKQVEFKFTTLFDFIKGRTGENLGDSSVKLRAAGRGEIK